MTLAAALRVWMMGAVLTVACDGTDAGDTGSGGSAGQGGGAEAGAAGSGAGAGLAGEAGQGGSGTGGGASCMPLSGDVGCQPPALPQTESLGQIIIVEAIPSGSGGPISDGEYELVAHVRYRTMPTAPETPTRMRAALRFRNAGTAMDYAFVEDDMSLPDSEATGFSAAVCTDGPSLLAQTSCPAGDGFDLTYTATSNEVILYEENEELRFQRR